MNGISVSIVVFLFKGIPEGMLTVLGLYMFTRTKITIKNYIILSLICTTTTYIIRFLPIALGVNTVLTLLIMIVAFQFVNKTQLSKVIRTVVSSAGIFILIATAEVLNMLLLIVLYGRTQAEVLFTSEDGLTQSIYTFPATVFFAALILLGNLILKKIDKRKINNGEDGTEAGE
ncbi:MAG: hypothetical protein EOM54_08370 [Clostridia bacterium]|nr:hypothetical protein [Clostridia bacterium]